MFPTFVTNFSDFLKTLMRRTLRVSMPDPRVSLPDLKVSVPGPRVGRADPGA